MNQLTLYFFLLISLKLAAQDSRLLLNGIVRSDSLPIENIHIINLRTKNGAISNSKGEFNIYAKLNDTLVISGIQFYTINFPITETVLANKKIQIELMQKINTLNEVELKTHDLIGNLMIDAKNYVDTISKANPEALNFDHINWEIESLFVAQMLDPDRFKDITNPMIPVGGDIIGLTKFLFKPLISEISKIGKNKRALKKEQSEFKKNAKKAPDKIREEFGNQFFVKDLNIDADQIDAFINYCKSKGAIDAYLKNNEIELIDIFIRESENFNQSISIQKSE